MLLARPAVVRGRPGGRDPLPVRVDVELQALVGLLQRVLGVALGQDRLVEAADVRGQPGLEGERPGQVEPVVAREDRRAADSVLVAERARGLMISPFRPVGPVSLSSLRVGVGQVSAWSTKSQIQPP